MRCGLRIVLSAALGVLIAGAGAGWAADPEIDKLVQSPVGKDWVTNGGNMTNERYSTLKQIDTSNVKQLKGAWMTRLKGSGLGGKYSFEATPLVKDGIMYISTGNDDVFALDAKTGQILWDARRRQSILRLGTRGERQDRRLCLAFPGGVSLTDRKVTISHR